MALVYCKTPDVIPQTYYCPTFSKLFFSEKKEQINKHIRMVAAKA
jgi:hypothetical protein